MPQSTYDALRDQLLALEFRGELLLHRLRPRHAPLKLPDGRPIPTRSIWLRAPTTAPSTLAALLRLLGYEDHLAAPASPEWRSWERVGDLQESALLVIREGYEAFNSGRRHGYDAGDLFPLITSSRQFAAHARVRQQLRESATLRTRLRTVAEQRGYLVEGRMVMAESLVHGCEWLYLMAPRLVQRVPPQQRLDLSEVRVVVHLSCHYRTRDEALFDPEIMAGRRCVTVNRVLQCLGAHPLEYATWYECCGRGALPEQCADEMALSLLRPAALTEATLMITEDVECAHHLAHSSRYSELGVAVLSIDQLVALACGVSPDALPELMHNPSPWRRLLSLPSVAERDSAAEISLKAATSEAEQ